MSRVTSAAICVDKLRLLREFSTENISVAESLASIEELDAQQLELEKRMAEIGGHGYESNPKELECKEASPE